MRNVLPHHHGSAQGLNTHDYDVEDRPIPVVIRQEDGEILSCRFSLYSTLVVSLTTTHS